MTAFLQLDDPYSYLLAHYLPALAEQYDILLDLRLSQALGDEFQPAPDLLAEYAINDCRRVARELGVPFLDRGSAPPTELRVALANAVAAGGTDLLEALSVYWRGDSEGAARRCDAGLDRGAADKVLAESEAFLRKLGHYNSAMLHYGGEWYWGVDRLQFLTERLDAFGAARNDTADPLLASIQQVMQYSLPVKPPTTGRSLPPLEYFHSPRSPYSYLGLARAKAVADAFGIEFRLRPVLPMVMRGMKVPISKMLYIATDTARVAEKLAIPYGRAADPVGPGTERVLAVWRFAEQEKRACDFLQSAGVAIWAEATDVATDRGMRKATARAGLFWPEAVEAMSREEWREIVEDNRSTMMAAGSWGVPTMRHGDFVIWGQDRIWLLVRHLEDLCETGDGILV